MKPGDRIRRRSTHEGGELVAIKWLPWAGLHYLVRWDDGEHTAVARTNVLEPEPHVVDR